MTVHQERTTESKSAAMSAMVPLTAFQPMADAYLAMWKQAGKFQAEMLRFMTARIEKDMAYSGRLLGCKNPGEMFQAQLDFFNGFLNDYLKEGRWVGDFANDAAKETQETLEREAGPRHKH